MTVIWKNLGFIGFDGYEVSTDGEVRSIKRKVKHRTGYKTINERILKPSCCSGYLGVNLSKNGKLNYMRIHKLVALAFVDNPENKPEIDHLDGDKHNNKANNLMWVTPKENMRHAKEIGRMEKQKKGKEVYKIDKKSYKIIDKYKSISEASRISGDSPGLIKKSCEGYFPRGARYIWMYVNDPFIYRYLS